MALPTTNLFSHLVADDLALTDGDPVTTWTKTAGSYATSPTASGTSRPTYRTNRLAGKAVLEFDGTDDYMTWGSVGDFNHMHDGTGGEVYVVFCNHSTGNDPNNMQTILDNTNLSSASRGIGIAYDDRTANSNSQSYLLQISKGSTGNSIISNRVQNAIPHNTWHCLRAAYKDQTGDDCFQWVNAASAYSAAQVNTPSVSNHSFATTIGRRSSSGDFYAKMYVAEIVVYDAILSTTDRDAVFDYLNGRYGPALVFNATDTPTSTVVDVAADADWKGGAHVAQTLAGSNLLAVWRRAADADRHDGVGQIKQAISTDQGETWAASSTIASDATLDDRDPAVTVASDGSVYVSYHERTENVGLSGLSYVKKSTDDGATYGSKVQITTSFTSFDKIAAPVLELANGDLLAPCYGRDTGDSFYSVRISKSTDDGATWANLAEVADGQTDSIDWVEPQLCFNSSGDILCTLRDETRTQIWISTSTDSGATWSTPRFAIFGNGAPRINLFTSADGYPVHAMMFRESNPASPEMVLSTDDGVTWSEGIYINGTSPQQYYYGGFFGKSDGTVHALWSENDSVTTDANVDVYTRELDTLGLAIPTAASFKVWYARNQSRLIGMGLN